MLSVRSCFAVPGKPADRLNDADELNVFVALSAAVPVKVPVPVIG
jgi:hypothetical protein